MKGDYDVVMWLDDDIYIYNMERTIESFLERFPDKDMIFSRDFEYLHKPANVINSGVFILKNTQLCKDFLNDVWEWRYKEVYPGFPDQSRINLMVLQRYLENAQIVSLGELQCFSRSEKCLESNPLGLHAAGRSSDERTKIFAQLDRSP